LGLPERLGFAPDALTREVLDLVEARFGDHFGDLEPFGYAVTAAQAKEALEAFITDCLPAFGDYQDAMAAGEPWLFHSVLSMYLNIGLLDPREAIARAEAAYRAGDAPLNAVEGFIRQILGWREYIRGLYWREMPGYAATNALAAHRPLPTFYWTGETDMACLRDVIMTTKRHAYAHHIQRLMVTGLFALLAGIDPRAVNEWYLIVYADAYEWVELPNVQGMALFADGGLLASKPYAASGKYIQRMSNYCAGCAYSVKETTGPRACPFNTLYWAFLIRHRERLSGNRRMAMIYRNLERVSQSRQDEIVASAEAFLDGLPYDRKPDTRSQT
jgi:deoxyribodipyrimidine photolyase-related protein